MAAELPPVVVDTNIIFSALLREPNRFAETIVLSGHRFYVCETVLVELFRRKEKILRLSQLRDDELAHVYHILLRRLQLEKEELIYAREALDWVRGSRVTGKRKRLDALELVEQHLERIHDLGTTDAKWRLESVFFALRVARTGRGSVAA